MHVCKGVSCVSVHQKLGPQTEKKTVDAELIFVERVLAVCREAGQTEKGKSCGHSTRKFQTSLIKAEDRREEVHI